MAAGAGAEGLDADKARRFRDAVSAFVTKAHTSMKGPEIALHGEVSGVGPSRQSEQHSRFFTGPYQRRVISKAGHYLPAEVPREFAGALLELLAG